VYGHFLKDAHRYKPTITKTIPVVISDGLKTHHHDQSITPVNLSVTNTIVKRPTKPIPDELDELLAIF
jgi:hypothetical protein